MITGLQLIALFAVLILSYFSFLSFKRNDFSLREYGGWQLLWLTLGLVTLFPERFSVWSDKFGSIRPLDFFTVMGFVVVLSISFYTYVNLDRLRKKLEKAIRDLALKDIE